MLTLLAALALAPPGLPKLPALTASRPQQSGSGDLNPMIEHYKSLKGLTYTVIHHGDVGDPKHEIAQRVFWAPDRFEITPIGYAGQPPALMPKLVCSDKQVSSLTPEGTVSAQAALDPGPDSIGAWEAQGGLLLVWLMDGKTWKRMTEPQEGVIQTFTVKGMTTWHDRPAKEIVMTHKTGTLQLNYSIFVSLKGDELLGTEQTVNGVDMWTEYKDEVPKP